MRSRRPFVAMLAILPLAGCYGISAGYGGPRSSGPFRGESEADIEAEHTTSVAENTQTTLRWALWPIASTTLGTR